MQRRGTLLLALGVVAVLGALYAVVSLCTPKAEMIATEQAEPLLSVEGDSAVSISFTTETEPLRLVKKDGFWYLSDDGQFPVDQDIPKNMLAILSSLTPLRQVSESSEEKALYGLDSPVCVTVSDAKGDHSFFLGDECSATEGYYFQSTADSPIYLVELSVGIAYCHQDRYDLIVMDPYPSVKTDEITRLELRVPGEQSPRILTQKEDSEESLWVWESADGEQEADSKTVAALLDAVSSLSFSRCLEYSQEEGEREKLFADGFGFTVDYLHKGKDEAGEELLSSQRFTLFVEAESYDAQFTRCRLSSSTQLCLMERSALEALWSLLT